jgi:epoxyqueuosine reductase
MNISAEKHTNIIRRIALELGFDACGISKAEPLDKEAFFLEAWLKKGMHGSMHYMEKHFDMRINPEKLVPGTRSVVSLLYNYYPQNPRNHSDEILVSKYAWGKDYHKIIKKKLKHFMHRIREEIGNVQGRYFVDSAPVLEKAWAARSGLGWIGKNGNLIIKRKGSFYFICELFLDIELIPDHPVPEHCGTCRKCMEVCPTGAITEPGVVDGSRCISYFTIELKDHLPIPEEMQHKIGNWLFGCDLCQDICPWNRFQKPTKDTEFDSKEYIQWNLEQWEHLTEEEFIKIMGMTPLKRPGYKGIMKNVSVIKKNISKKL